MTEPPQETRIEFAESRPEFKFESHPNFTQYAKEQGDRVWDLLDTMEEIARESRKSSQPHEIKCRKCTTIEPMQRVY